MRIAGGLKAVFQAGGKKGKGVKERAFACTMLANDSRQLGEGPFSRAMLPREMSCNTL